MRNWLAGILLASIWAAVLWIARRRRPREPWRGACSIRTNGSGRFRSGTAPSRIRNSLALGLELLGSLTIFDVVSMAAPRRPIAPDIDAAMDL